MKKAHELYPIVEKYDNLMDNNDIDGVNQYFKTITQKNHIMEISALLRVSGYRRHEIREWYPLFERGRDKIYKENLNENILRNLATNITGDEMYPIVHYFSELFQNKEVEKADEVLSCVSMDLRMEYMIAIIRTTFPARNKLKNWHSLRDRMLTELNERGLNGEHHLRGLFR